MLVMSLKPQILTHMMLLRPLKLTLKMPLNLIQLRIPKNTLLMNTLLLLLRNMPQPKNTKKKPVMSILLPLKIMSLLMNIMKSLPMSTIQIQQTNIMTHLQTSTAMHPLTSTTRNPQMSIMKINTSKSSAK